MEQRENLLDLINVLWNWRRPLILMTLIATILTAVVSLFLPNYYKSTSIFYAAHTDLAKPAAIGENEQRRLYYGESEDLNRLMSIAKSGKIYDFLINEFDLYEHYEIKKESKNARHKLNLKLEKLYNAKKTKYDALELSIEDKDPEVARNMVNAARNELNKLAQTVVKESQKSLLDNYNSSIDYKTKELKKLSDSLNFLRKTYGVYNLEEQSGAYAQLAPKVESRYFNKKAKLENLKAFGGHRDSIASLESTVKGLKKQYDNLSTKLGLFNKGYLPIFTLEKEQKAFTLQFAIDKQRQQLLLGAYNAPFNAIHLIEDGSVPVYKNRPKRSIIVIGIGMVVFVLGAATVILLDQLKKK